MGLLFADMSIPEIPRYQQEALNTLSEYENTEDLLNLLRFHIFPECDVQKVVRSVLMTFKKIKRPQHNIDYEKRKKRCCKSKNRNSRCIQLEFL
jgi:hypothetical protein